MTEEDWLDACAEKPDDDLRRHAFADWLEDRGDACRAEFIRLQVALSRVPERLRAPAQVRRASNLLFWHRKRWLGPLADLIDTDCWQFSRGLPEILDLQERRLGEEDVARLTTSPHLARITELQLKGSAIRDAGAQALTVSPFLDRLNILGLWNNKIGDAGAAALVATPCLARLTTLDLGYNHIGSAGARALAASPHLSRLTVLNLFRNEIGDGGAQALAASLPLQRLTLLILNNNQIGDAGKRELRQAFGDRVRVSEEPFEHYGCRR